jgi:hypothetical protein
VALGGTGYAALTITGANVKNGSLTGRDVQNGSLTGGDVKTGSVGGVDVRNGSLHGADVATGTLSAGNFRAGDLPRGPQGPKGDKGDKGATGNAFPDVLPRGTTVRGMFAMAGRTDGVNFTEAADSISFGATFSAAPAPHIIFGGFPSEECPGTLSDPVADPGQLCIYVKDNVKSAGIGYSPANITRWGAVIDMTGNTISGAGTFRSNGVWAATAP